jgi:hypothetical protein
MPAIQIKRARKQIQALAERFDDPVEFRRYLLDLLDQYADRTYRAGQIAEPPPLIDTYNVPLPLIRELVQVLGPQVTAEPVTGQDLLDMLWSVPSFETRLIAIRLLMYLPITAAGMPRQVADLARSWVHTDIDLRLVEALMNQGLAELIKHDQPVFLELAHAWLESPELFIQDLGLRALSKLSTQPGYTNYPPLFKLITPLARESSPVLRPALSALLRGLASRSPHETSYYFQELLEAETSPQTAMLIRGCLDELPAHLANNVRKKLRR